MKYSAKNFRFVQSFGIIFIIKNCKYGVIMAKIVVTIPGGRRKTYILDEHETIIGRSPNCTVVIEDKKASREHLRIQMIAGVISAEDLDSSNGTMFLNQKINKKTIDDRDILTIGDVKIQFFFDNEADPDIALSKKKRSFEQAAAENKLVQINPDGSVIEIVGEYYYIEILDGDFQGLKIVLEGKLTIGRHQQNSLVLTGKKVSSQHAIIDSLGNETYITDLGSTNGTLVNTRKIEPNSPVKLSHGTIIEIGEHRISFNVPERKRPSEPDPMAEKEGELSVLAAHSLIFVGGQRDGERIPMSKRITIGRKDFNSICLPSPEVSGEHCEIFYDEGCFVVKDIDSANGTYINGKKIRDYHILEHGDMISLGDTMIVFDQAGKVLDIDDRIRKIRSWASRRIQKSLFISLTILVLALLGLYAVTDMTLTYLVENKVAKIEDDLEGQVSAGLELDDKFIPIPELSFEYDPSVETKIPGWDLFIHNRGCDFTFDNEFKSDGKWALAITPKKSMDPRAEIRLTSNNQLDIKMKDAVKLGAVKISALASALDFDGVMGIRTIWQTQLSPKIETVKYYASREFKNNVYKELSASVEIPEDVISFGIQIFVRGNATKIWFDKINISKAVKFENSVYNPVIFTDVLPDKKVTAAKNLKLTMEKPMSADISRGDLKVISDVSPTLLNNLETIRHPGGSPLQFSTSMSLEDLPAIDVRKLSEDSYVYSLMMYSDISKNILSMTFDYARKDDCYEIVPDLSNIDLSQAECMALRLNLLAPKNINPKYHLRLFNADDEGFIMLQKSATVENVSEIAWGNYSGYTGIRINPGATVFFKQQPDGYEVYILLKGLIKEKGNPRIQFYGYSPFENMLKNNALIAGLKMLTRKENCGDALILAQRIMKAFEADTEFKEKVNKELNFNVLNNEQQTLSNRVKNSWEYIQTKNHDNINEALNNINDGIKAAEEFIQKYSALFKQEEIKDKLRDLRNEKPHYMQKLSSDDKQKRLDDAQELLYRARKYLDEQSSEYSLLQAMIFLNALINKYIPVVQVTDEIDAKLNLVIEDAIKQKHEIEKLWNDHDAEEKYIKAKIVDIKTAIENEEFMKAKEISRKIFLKYPFTKYRDEIEALFYGN